MNSINRHLSIVNRKVKADQRLPSYADVAKDCRVSLNQSQAIIRRYMIYQYIQSYIKEKGFSPTRREIAQSIPIPLSVIQYHIRKLIEAELIVQTDHHPRTLRVHPLEHIHG